MNTPWKFRTQSSFFLNIKRYDYETGIKTLLAHEIVVAVFFCVESYTSCYERTHPARWTTETSSFSRISKRKLTILRSTRKRNCAETQTYYARMRLRKQEYHVIVSAQLRSLMARSIERFTETGGAYINYSVTFRFLQYIILGTTRLLTVLIERTQSCTF